MAKSSPKKRKPSKKKSKKFNIPPGFIIGGVFFLVIAIIAVTVLNIKVNTLKKLETKVTKKEEKSVSPDSIDQYIRTVLKNIKQHNNFIRKKDVTEYGDSFELQYEIVLEDHELYKFKNSLAKKMRLYHFSVNDNGEKLVFSKSGKQLTILFKDEPKVVTKKPIKKVIPKSTGPMISIILDDAGRDLKSLKKILNNPHPITIATIPFTRHDRETVTLTKKAGKTAFLHLPCEPKSYPKTNPGKGAIFLNTPPALVEVTLQKSFERVGKVDGFNNHMGSALTENRKKMTQVLKASKKYTNTYVDSRTSPNTVAFDVCQEQGMVCGMNRKFIDNQNDHPYIRSRLDNAAQYAAKHGEAIIIGHLKPDTVAVLIDYLPVLEKRGIKIVPITEVLH